MKSAGTVYDELTDSKEITRIGVVDLGTLPWNSPISANPNIFYCNSITEWINLIGERNNAICSKYERYDGTISGANLNDLMLDKQFVINKGNNGITGNFATGSLLIKDSSYSTVEEFKTAMSGIMLFYELATPIETDIDVDFNLSLNVNEGENLQLLPVGTDTPASAPLCASVTTYKSGATGNDVEKLLGSIAQVETSPATTNHAEGDYIMYNYQLYKVTASITTGASLVVGTNITATTVMDEFKTL